MINHENNCLVSIITINFNDSIGLEKTLESVRSQTFESFEHIIIDGGSTDGSVAVIKEFLSDEDYAKHITFWCSEKDNGIYNAMNKGIMHANGKFVYMLNAGDILLNNVLENISEYLIKNDDCVLYGAVDCYDNNDFEGTVCKPAKNLNKIMIPHQGTFVSLSLNKKMGLYNENYKILADRELMVRFYKSKVTFIHIPIIICNYNLEGVSSKVNKLKDKEMKLINDSFLSQKRIVYMKIRHIVRIIFEMILPGFISIPLINLIRSNRKRGSEL